MRDGLVRDFSVSRKRWPASNSRPLFCAPGIVRRISGFRVPAVLVHRAPAGKLLLRPPQKASRAVGPARRLKKAIRKKCTVDTDATRTVESSLGSAVKHLSGRLCGFDCLDGCEPVSWVRQVF